MSSSDIVALREATGAGVVECKKALEEAGGDVEKAKQLIWKRGYAKAASKAQRKTGAGMIEAYVHSDRIGVIVEVRCETDFVAKTPQFRELAHDIALQVASMDPESVEALMVQPFIKDESLAVKDIVARAVAVIGENIRVERFCRYEL